MEERKRLQEREGLRERVMERKRGLSGIEIESEGVIERKRV